MRDIALTLMIVGVLPFALRYTWVGVLLYTWLSVMNPHKLAFGFANEMPFAFVAAGATLLSILWNTRQLRLRPDPIVLTLALFVAWLCVSTVFALFPAQSLVDLQQALKIQLMIFVAIAALRERRHIELFLWVNVLSIGFYGVKGGLFTIVSGGAGRVWGPPGGFIEGNNELGLALVMTIPLMNYLRAVSRRAWVRHGLLLAMLLCAVAALGTQSRGSFLAVVAMAVVLMIRSNRKLLSGVALVAIGLLLLAFLPDTWEARMRTIETYQQDSSAQGRINAWLTAIHVANDRLTGAGFSMEWPEVFARYAPNPEIVFTAHSIYFQVMGEQGYIGFLLFVALGLMCWRTAGRLRKQGLSRPETLWLHDLGGMIQVSMVGYGVGGAFLSLAYFDLPYNILAVVVACKYWLVEERWTKEARGAFGAGAPTGRLTQRPPGAAPAR